MNANGQLIETLAHSEMFQNYERAYTEAVGLPLALRPLETWQLPLHGRRKENPFCAMMATKSQACSACLQTQAALARRAMHGTTAIKCGYGLCEIAVPIKLGAHVIGFLQTGQIMRRKPTADSIGRTMRRAGKSSADWKVDHLRSALMQTRVLPARVLDAVKALLSIFAEHLAIKSNELMLAQASAEPMAITKAKHYINEHFAEPLSLGQVSKAVNTSLFHFCKRFKAVTGITFTEFVSRVRVEKSKNLLLNRNLRVGEIAIESGFQSLTHFNRMFKEMVGVSPTGYRDHLPHISNLRLNGGRRQRSQRVSHLEPGALLPGTIRERPLPDLTPLERPESGELVEAAA